MSNTREAKKGQGQGFPFIKIPMFLPAIFGKDIAYKYSIFQNEYMLAVSEKRRELPFFEMPYEKYKFWDPITRSTFYKTTIPALTKLNILLRKSNGVGVKCLYYIPRLQFKTLDNDQIRITSMSHKDVILSHFDINPMIPLNKWPIGQCHMLNSL